MLRCTLCTAQCFRIPRNTIESKALDWIGPRYNALYGQQKKLNKWASVIYKRPHVHIVPCFLVYEK